MWRSLVPHPDSAGAPAIAIEAGAEWAEPWAIRFTYRLTGALDRVRWAEPGLPKRADELWKHTCLEAFLRRPGEDGYVELNFAPSLRWAAYAFDGYRSGMRNADPSPLIVNVERTPGEVLLTAEVGLGVGPAPLSLALTAVIEDMDGARTYWALAHPQGKPDFHHAAGFVLDLSPPERT